MSFQVGDKVAIDGFTMPATVEEILVDGIYAVFDNGGRWSGPLSFLTPYRSARQVETQPRAFRVGDRVRVVKMAPHHKHTNRIGEVGEIKSVRSDMFSVYKSGTVWNDYPADCLELVEAAPAPADPDVYGWTVGKKVPRLQAENARLSTENARLSTENAELHATLDGWTTGAEATKLQEERNAAQNDADEWIEIAEHRRLLIESMKIGADKHVAREVELEREACAQTAERHEFNQGWLRKPAAAAIRARGHAAPVVDKDEAAEIGPVTAGIYEENVRLKAELAQCVGSLGRARVGRDAAFADADRWAARVQDLEARLAKVREVAK